MEFGEQLKEWRGHRRMSQLDLATEAGISARHLSFLETGRSRPSEGMILRLSAVLAIPARRDAGLHRKVELAHAPVPAPLLKLFAEFHPALLPAVPTRP